MIELPTHVTRFHKKEREMYSGCGVLDLMTKLRSHVLTLW